MHARRILRRRVRVMMVMVLIAIGTGGWALSGSGAAVSVHLIVDAVAVIYAALVYESRRRYQELTRKLRALARHPLSARPAGWSVIDDEPIVVHREDEPLIADDFDRELIAL